MSRRGSGKATRGYGLTRWGRAFVDVVEGRDTGASDSRRITQARRYFRDLHAERLHIGESVVTASVRGSQLEPFDVILTLRSADPATVVTLLRAQHATADLMALARGEQPATLGELIMPTESSDIAADCSCPDESPRCIHVLCVAYEVAAEIDRTAAIALTLVGVDLPALLSAASAETPVSDSGDERRPTVDFYGSNALLPPLPSPERMNPVTDLDIALLRTALRANGIPPSEITEALDVLDELYDRIRRPYP